ncbi:RNA polymerase sigma factor [Candidatus Uhrbacteria bacterium]|nr:RNA polymerase sigma factor [Candidatus Uhrbacteria bacterium]
MTRSQLQAFYNSHVAQIYRFVLFRVGGNAPIAEDLTSEIFLRAVEHLATLQKSGSPVAWLYTVARNRLKQHYRDHREEVNINACLAISGSDDALKRLGREYDVMQALHVLDDDARRMVEMRYLEGWSYRDMSALLDVPAHTLRVRVHRAMKQLKRNVSDV